MPSLELACRAESLHRVTLIIALVAYPSVSTRKGQSELVGCVHHRLSPPDVNGAVRLTGGCRLQHSASELPISLHMSLTCTHGQCDNAVLQRGARKLLFLPFARKPSQASFTGIDGTSEQTHPAKMHRGESTPAGFSSSSRTLQASGSQGPDRLVTTNEGAEMIAEMISATVEQTPLDEGGAEEEGGTNGADSLTAIDLEPILPFRAQTVS